MKYDEGVMGEISDIDAAKMLVKIKIYEADEFTTGWLPLMVIPGTYYVPAAQDQVFAIMTSDYSTGIVIGGAFNPPPFSDPDVIGLKFDGVDIQINKKSGAINIVSSGDAQINANKIKLNGDMEFTGNLKLIGDATLQGDTSASGKITAVGVVKSMTDVRTAQASLTTHTHLSAAPGSPTGPTLPIPQP